MPEGICKGYHRRTCFENGSGGIARRLRGWFGRRRKRIKHHPHAPDECFGGQWRGHEGIVFASVGEMIGK
jgi:hypothetical protein